MSTICKKGEVIEKARDLSQMRSRKVWRETQTESGGTVQGAEPSVAVYVAFKSQISNLKSQISNLKSVFGCHPERSRFSGVAKDLPLNRPIA